MRGALGGDQAGPDLHGIIPADAGSTASLGLNILDFKDHPRGCGEHPKDPAAEADKYGSSPRMRGAPDLNAHDHASGGIIPADAGSTPVSLTSSGVVQDHPRGCGEHSELALFSALNWGSSPRMRGAQRHCESDQGTDGIIPADAGSTAGQLVRVLMPVDHPRGCGEHLA